MNLPSQSSRRLSGHLGQNHPSQGHLTKAVTNQSRYANARKAGGSAQAATEHSKPLFRNQYEIVRRLARGGFGTTYLAKDAIALHDRACVIKQIRYKQSTPHTSTEKAFNQERNHRRFQKEARIMARLGRHSQLPCLLDHFVENEQFYLVQEHIAGNTLSQELHRSGPQTEAQVKAFIKDMVPIIRYVHRHNLLHLDIKPSNIIRRSQDQKLVLIDFGAVRRYFGEGGIGADGLVSAERCTGTVGFSPAEQLAGQPVPASDLYALGVTCLYLLTGCSPLDFATSPKGQNLRWQESVQVSSHMRYLLQKMLHPEAGQRFQSVDELDQALGLEHHYTELQVCMTHEPYGDYIGGERFERPEACLLDSYVKTTAQSGAARRASSIRRWQQRRRRFKSFTPK
ncbi:MAG: serine/threonine-protein kinase [Cyanobacteria bacterium J06607_13]